MNERYLGIFDVYGKVNYSEGTIEEIKDFELKLIEEYLRHYPNADFSNVLKIFKLAND